MKTKNNKQRLKTYKIKAVNYTDAVKKYNKHIIKDALPLVETIGDYTIRKNNDDFLKFAVFYKGQIIAETTTVDVAKRQIKQHMNDYDKDSLKDTALITKEQILSQLTKHFKDRFDVFIYGNDVEITSDTVTSPELFDVIHRKNIFGKHSNDHMSAPHDEDFVLLKLDKMNVDSAKDSLTDSLNDDESVKVTRQDVINTVKAKGLTFTAKALKDLDWNVVAYINERGITARQWIEEITSGNTEEVSELFERTGSYSRYFTEDADFYGAKQGSEKADDVLFALQAHYGLPKYDYDDFRKMNLTQEQVNEAVAYAERDELNKFTYFENVNSDREE